MNTPFGSAAQQRASASDGGPRRSRAMSTGDLNSLAGRYSQHVSRIVTPPERAATVSSTYYLDNVEEYENRRARQSTFYHDLAAAHSIAQLGVGGAEYEEWWARQRQRTTLLVNMANIMERADEQVLPAVYRFIGATYGASISQLGYLVLSRAFVQALASPLGGILGHQFNRISIVVMGCFLWGLMIITLGTTSELWQGMAVCAVNGVGLALVIPNVQSITADYYNELDRGKAFGVLYLTGAVGAAFGSTFATNLGGFYPFGYEGWRFVFFTVGIASIAIGALTMLYGHDPRYAKGNEDKLDRTHNMGEMWAEVRQILTTSSFLIILLQGVVGTSPWNALVFFTLYLQLLGMSNFAASSLMSIFLLATAAGGMIGGWVGDAAASRFPNHWRIAVTQLSIVLGVPLSVVLLKVLPHNAELGTMVSHALLLSAMGILITWAAPACNNPIFAEIVPPHLRTMIYAFDRSFEMALAALGAPLVGIIAERWFGYTGSLGEGGSAGADIKNAEALGEALLWSMVVPWALCFLFYTLLHVTYPRDKEYALLQMSADEADAMGAAGGYRKLPAHEADESPGGEAGTPARHGRSAAGGTAYGNGAAPGRDAGLEPVVEDASLGEHAARDGRHGGLARAGSHGDSVVSIESAV